MPDQVPRAVVVGAPRTGFSLLINICTSTLSWFGAQRRRPPGDRVLEGLVKVASEHVRAAYQRAFRELGLERDVVFNGEFHLLVGGPKWLDPEDPTTICVRKYVGIRGQGDFLLIVRHPRRALEYYPVLHTHENPKLWLETPYYDPFLKLASMRNPIGVINSASFSINAMASEYIQRFMPDADEDAIRQRLALYKLTDLDFFRGLIAYLRRELDKFLEVRERYFVMKWEDLIRAPLRTIKQVGQALGYRLSDAAAHGIWAPMDHKNLMQHHKHNYRRGKGIVGDWKNSLVNEHMELFRQEGFDDYLAALGYPPVPELNPRDYSPYQRLVARHLQRGEQFSNTGDPDLFGMAFNKSNIDASCFNFKSFPRRRWTHVERSTVEDDRVVERISDRVEQACAEVNELLAEGGALDLRGGLQAGQAVARVERQSRALAQSNPDPALLKLHQEVFAPISAAFM
jgi:Sulfotransferase domain